MSEFEKRLREAFHDEDQRRPPPPGLRQRMIANAVATPRSRWRTFLITTTAPRLALIGAAAAVLLVAGVAGIYATTHRTPQVAIHPTPSAPATLAFGKLPAPALHPLQGFGGGGSAPTVVPYYGPATLSWSALMPRGLASAPVERFPLPAAADADAFASRLGAVLRSADAATRVYRRPDGFELAITFNDPVAGEPSFIMNQLRTTTPGPTRIGEAGARAAAADFLQRVGLTPAWKNAVIVTRFTAAGEPAAAFIVQYQRVIPVSSEADALEVDFRGDPSGVQVLVNSSGQVVHLAGVLRLTGQTGQTAAYPLRPPSAALRDALAAPPLTHESGPVPAVALTHAQLVYVAVTDGSQGYLEPAYLFTGTFTRDGTTFEKRVLVPALAPNATS